LAKRKVLVIIDSLGEGGAQRIVADVINACSDMAEIDLIALYWFDFEKNYYDSLQSHCRLIKTLCRPTRNKFEKAIFRGWVQFTHWRMIRDLIATNNYDIIHTHMIMANDLIYKLRREFPKLPVLGTYHSNFDHQPYRRNMRAAKALEQHDHVFCDLEAGYHDLKGVFKDTNKLEYLDFGIDSSYFAVRSTTAESQKQQYRRKYGLPIDAQVLLSIARIDFHDRKIDEFINAFAAVSKAVPGAVLVIVGTGKDLPAAKRLVAKIEITDKVYFLGHSNDLHPLYAMSDAYLTITCRDDVGVAGKQAIAAAVPTFALTLKPNTLGSGRFFSDAITAGALAEKIVAHFRDGNGYRLAEQRSQAMKQFCDGNDMITRHRQFYGEPEAITCSEQVEELIS